jgi:hypothetical protein
MLTGLSTLESAAHEFHWNFNIDLSFDMFMQIWKYNYIYMLL